jgi:hypothetical protein
MTAKASWGLALLIAATLLLAGLAVLPFALRSADEDTLAEKQLELRFMQSRLKAAKNGPKNRLTENDDIDQLFVAGTTPGLAIAEMQAIAGKLADASGMAVQRLQPLQADREGNLALLRIEAELTGNIESLRQYLLSIETGQPMMFVNHIKVAAPESVSDAGVLPSEQLTVTLQLESFGWWEGTP